MNEDEALNILNNVFDQLDIRQGDRVMLGIDMGRMPLPHYPAQMTREGIKKREMQWCAFIYNSVLARLTDAGTLLVPAYSYSCTRPQSCFVLEQTPSEVGPFTEFFRKQPQVVRSIHPVFSVCGLGTHAADILTHTGKSGFGVASPFGRFLDFGVKFLCLGVEISQCITYLHHLEQQYGCAHRFNKMFHTDVEVSERKVRGPWFAYLNYRWLDYSSDFRSFQDKLQEGAVLKETQWQGRKFQCADVVDVDRVGYQMLEQNSLAFVDRHFDLAFDDSHGGQVHDQSHTASITITTTP